MEFESTSGSGAQAPAPERVHILVVEDELLIRMFVSEALRDEGYSVIEAFNGDEAAEILKAGKAVNLVFSDVRMPGSLDGIGLLKLIKERFPAIPVILASGHLDPNTGLAEGANYCITKPYGVGELLDLVAMGLAK